MMKFKLLSLLLLSFVFFSCKKEENFELENNLEAYLAQTNFNQKVEEYYSTTRVYEMGLKFKPLANGNIKALTLKIPSNQSNVRVTLWDVATKKKLETFTFNNVLANSQTNLDIKAYRLNANTEYLLSYTSGNYYYRTTTTNSNANYPINIKSIQYTGFVWEHGAENNAVYPEELELDYYAGDLSFVFQKEK